MTHGFLGPLLGPAPLQECVGDFCCVNFGGFAGDFPGGYLFFWALFPHKNEKKKNSGDKIREKIRRPQKERSAKNPFCQKPTLTLRVS